MVLIAVGIMLIECSPVVMLLLKKAFYDAFVKTQTIKSSQNDMEFSLNRCSRLERAGSVEL